MPVPSLDDLLRAAVAAVGGTEREGQTRMAHAVADAARKDEHLIVQAGTGTGKSLAYLVPAIATAFETRRPVVVATATLALQAQIVDRDLPRIADALAPLLGRRPTFELVKGRANYLCLHKLDGGFPPDDEGSLLSTRAVVATSSPLGAEVVRLREWADLTDTGDRDRLVPGVSGQAWRQVSVSARECLGSRCPMVAECFVERAREKAREVDVVVTNHSFMAIDAFENRSMLPEHDLLIIDEAHELTDRVTSTVAKELTPAMVAAAARAANKTGADASALEECSILLGEIMDDLDEGRLRALPQALAVALGQVLDLSRDVQSQLKGGKDADADGARQQAKAAVDEVHQVAERLLDSRELDVTWVGIEQRRGAVLHVAPMSVAMALREHLFGERTVVLTSATIELGGSFDAVAGTLGLRGEGAPEWTGLDVGSPFDYRKQGMVYVARDIPPPGREGTSPKVMDELEALIRAAGGRTLGLFSSMRAATAATEEMRARLGEEYPVLCQGDDQMPTLVREFASDARTCLFGTLSLWQGVDVPGPACQLVVIDRIPFPRPDDPLAAARTEHIGRLGGNGFLAVSGTHAALRLAQGSGRLIRRLDDRGVVAFLDSRMVTARYAGFLQRSIPGFWPCLDRGTVLAALRRLDESAGPVMPPPRLGGETLQADGGGADHPAPVPVAEGVRTAVVAGRGWTREDDEELREGVALGLDLAELTDHLDREPEDVAARAAALRLEVGAPPGLDIDV